MQIKSATDARKNLSTLIREVAETKEDLGIQLNGEVVAILTVKRPQRVIEPVWVTVEHAKNGWADLIQAVAARRARFVFKRKKENISYIVYLVPNRSVENPFVKQWRQHVEKEKALIQEQDTNHEWKTAQIEMHDQIALIQEQIQELTSKVTYTFALINRNNDLLKTPENGVIHLADEDDLDRY